MADMTVEEKLAQLYGMWIGASGDSGEMVAPMMDEMLGEVPPFEEFAKNGLGQLTRIFGTHPVEPAAGAKALMETQRWLKTNTRLGIPALSHEECLTGLAAWKATTFPTPLAWGASFDPDLVGEMSAAIGDSMVRLGIHQGLSPVLDVIRDARWGRVEECIGEDPYLVGSIGSAYVKGLEGAGIIATLKHFVGYSNSRAGRNLAPVHAGPREIADVLLIPFEMAVLDAGVRSVMNSYAEIDGVPVAADPKLLTGLLRDRWGFEGTVVADYFAFQFLRDLHGVAEDFADAGRQALAAGIDIELPTGRTLRQPMVDAINAGDVDIAIVDRALERVLLQKASIGLLDATFEEDAPTDIDLDPAEHRAIAARLAEESVVLLANDGTLPLAAGSTIAVVGPNADRAPALFGCYSFINHVLSQHPGTAQGIDVPTVLSAIRSEQGADAVVAYEPGCAVDDADTSGIADAVAAATRADVAVVVVGDQAGLFGRGTVGEGCDRDSLELPGVQRQLVEAVLETGTPVVLVMVTGRPYAVDWALDRCAAAVQAFFPGEEGAAAIAGALSGRINPSGRLPVSLPRSVGAQPYSYLRPPLGGQNGTSNLDTAPARPFGFGLTYTDFRHRNLRVASGEVASDGAIVATVTVTNTGERDGSDIVQLYGHDVVGSVTRPVAQLLGYARVDLAAGERADVTFVVPTTRLAFSDRDLVRIVEPGKVDLWVGSDCETRDTEKSIVIVGDVHHVSLSDARMTLVEVAR
ncbi:glycoside hydrolase family 3 protein [Demequina aurantiaca]|uniref:beta-xylosidase/alpha-l-arabinosidase n=1 Tax=Demequina aurantiaca TaxID=676200 RepID=UPI001F004734|nr:glycoside hydrolase family 3 N-terminal domain-containing protein [Demequina aurantiaca]